MYIKLLELRARRGANGRPLSLKAVSEGTGIDQRTLENISSNKVKMWRPEYFDALATFFECSPDELIGLETVELPLDLVLRPDRRGKPVGKEIEEAG